MTAIIMHPAVALDSGPEADSKKAKAKRQSRPKVKTGCSNCKQRRIKCDETRPACKNCVKSRRDCTGYPPPPRRNGYEAPLIAPRPIAGASTLAPAIRPAPPATPIAQNSRTVVRRVLKESYRVERGLGLPSPQPTPPRPLVTQVPLPQTPIHIPLPIAVSQAHHGMQLQQLQAATMFYQPTMMPLTEVEGMYFQLFRSSTAGELSGYFDAGFWTRSVLQGAEIEPAIRHAVIALGALYKTLEKTIESPPTSPHGIVNIRDTPDHHWKVAFQQYSRACEEMTRIRQMERQSMRTQLMANVLLACFDSFIGDHEQAISQIKNGLILLERFKHARDHDFVPISQEPIDEDLIRMFTRLAIQAKTYDMAFHFPEPHVVRLVPQAATSSTPPLSPVSEPEAASPSALSFHIPQTFLSLIDARCAWDRLVYTIFRFTEVGFQSSKGPMGLLPQDIQRYGQTFHQQLRDWGTAFEPLFLSRHHEGVPYQVKAGLATLKMTYVMSYVLFVMTFQHNELAFDEYKPQFEEIIRLALEVVEDQERRAAAAKGCDPNACMHKFFKVDIFGKCPSELLTFHIKPSFSADMGIVQPLFVVATKCRDATIRRQAIQLLRNSARREAMWDSELCARIGQWIVEIEEDGDDAYSSPPAFNRFPPEFSVPHTQQQQHQQQQQQQLLQQQQQQPASLSPPRQDGRHGSIASVASSRSDFGDSLGPGGNGTWNWNIPRRASFLTTPPAFVREEKRVMVSAVQMNLKKRQATIRCGTRGIKKGQIDTRAQSTDIYW